MTDARTSLVTTADDGIRLDRWFKRRFPALTHGRLEKLLRTGQIRVDGKRARANFRLAPGQTIRVGGLVEEGSVAITGDGSVRFRVTDLKTALPVTYRGVLPDLFREGQGVVAQGTLGPDGAFAASEVLAKHDETYMPPEVAEALKKSGRWREGAEVQ